MKTAAITSRTLTGAIVGIGVAFLLSACSGVDEGDPASGETTASSETTIEELSDGTVVVHYDGVGEPTATDGTPGGDPDPSFEASEKRNCMYIQYCNLDGRIICRTRDCGCTLQEATNECFRDAKAVCGNTRNMTAYVCYTPQ
jgi:hypothetical protein